MQTRRHLPDPDLALGLQQGVTNSLDQMRFKAEANRRLEEGDGLEFTPAQFAAAVHAEAEEEAVKAFLDDLVTTGNARRIDTYRCPMAGCPHVFPPGDGRPTACPACGTDYEEQGV